MRVRQRGAPIALIALLGVAGSAAAEECGPPIRVDLQAQLLSKSLIELGVPVWFALNSAPGDTLAPRIKGAYTICDVLRQLLAGTPFKYRRTPRGYEIYRDPSGKASGSLSEAVDDEVQVVGTRSRTRDGALPIFVLDAQSLRGPSAFNLVSALGDNLPPNALKAPTDPTADVFGLNLGINLRGMGSSQTLVLIDGRRVAGNYLGGDTLQTDLSTIVPSQVKRVVVLPASGSGMYGGGATAGVIDVITRREADGIELEGSSERFSNGGRDSERLTVTTGTSLAEDQLQLGMSATFARQSPILTGDRDFAASNRGQIERHNPGYFASAGIVPLGATTNILALDGHLFGPDGPANTFVPANSSTTDLTGLARNAGHFNLSLADSAQLQGGSGYAMRSDSTFESALGWASYASGPWSVTLDAGASHRTRKFGLSGADYSPIRNVEIPASANPFGETVRVTIPVSAGGGLLRSEVEARRAILAATYRLPHDWQVQASHAWSDSSLTVDRPMFELDPRILTEGRVNLFVDPVPDLEALGLRSRLHVSALRTVLEETSLGLAGPLFQLPAGALMLDARVDHRRERYGAGGARESREIDADQSSTVLSLLPEQSQRVDGAAAELAVPILANAEPNQVEMDDDPNVRLLAQLSVRTDRYSTRSAPDYLPGETPSYFDSHFSSTNFSTALRFDLMPGLRLRGSYSTGFLPPIPKQLAAARASVLPAGVLLDPARGGQPSQSIALLAGGNPELTPEHSRSYSAGFVLHSQVAGDMRLSVDFVRITKTDVVFSPADMLVDNPTEFLREFGDSIQRAPVSEGDRYPVGPITAIDVTSRNLLRAEINAWDVAYDHSFSVGDVGKLSVSLLGTFQPRFASQASRGSELRNHAGRTSESPLRYHVSGGATLDWRDWVLGWEFRYLPRYLVSEDPVVQANQGGKYVSDHLYQDVFARRRFELGAGAGRTLEVEVGVRNLGNQRPSLDAGAPMFDYRSPFGGTQMVTGYVSVRTAF